MVQREKRIGAVDRVEVLTLADNFIEITAMDNSAIVSRARYLLHGKIQNSILAEHGFSALVQITSGKKTRSVLFDFGFSRTAAAANARMLGAPLGVVEALVLSHGHSDHFGGIAALRKMIPRESVPLYVHPGAFKPSRYLKFGQSKAYFPQLGREALEKMGIRVVASREPRVLLGGNALFLGEVRRRTEFEKGMPFAFFERGRREYWDAIEEDSALVADIRGKGLFILSGCAHAGIINTIEYAREVTGIPEVFAVMGGFHLAGPAFEPAVAPTAEALKKFRPGFVIPTHCTGRNAVMLMEKEFPGRFILNMSGTKLTFSA